MIRGSPEKHKVHEPGAHVIHKYYKIINTHYTSGIIVMVYRSLLQESIKKWRYPVHGNS